MAMQWQVFIAVGLIATGTALVTFKGAFGGGVPRRLGLLVSTVGSIVWGYWGVNAYDVQTVTDSGCCVYTHSYEPLAFLGFGMMLVMFGIAVMLLPGELEEWGR